MCIAKYVNCVHAARSPEQSLADSFHLVSFTRKEERSSQTLASITTFHTSPIAVPQISCDVTHHSGVFTACCASVAWFTALSHTCLERRGKAIHRLQRECVTGDDLSKHVLLLIQTAERRGRDGDLNRLGGGAVEEKIKTPPIAVVHRNIH